MPTFVAVDVGASSGRVMLGDVGAGRLALHEAHRFRNGPVRLPDGLHWDAVGLFREVLAGLHAAGRLAGRLGLAAPSSIGIDTWAVDYGLLDADGALLGEPWCYRDGRTARGVAAVHDLLPHERLHEVNGLQFLPFTTLYQLAAERPAALARASTLLLLPDLLGYWLTGVAGAELTNASTTGLLDVRSRTWSTGPTGLTTRLGLDAALLPPLRRPGDVLGTLLPHVAEETGLAASTPVVAVGSHDTASAVVGAPLTSARAAYVSCGTWALVGLELPAPVLTPASRAANFTNELGVDDRVRYLRNVMGLWLLAESVRTWTAQGLDVDLPALLTAAERLPAGPVVDADDPAFLPPGDMPTRIADACRRTGQEAPAGPPAVVRCIVDSLAAAFARAVADAGRLAQCEIDAVHVVGGGALNALLCRLTAAACGLPVIAGPVEATALGNVLVQARAAGVVPGGLEPLRALVRATQPLTRYDPGP